LTKVTPTIGAVGLCVCLCLLHLFVTPVEQFTHDIHGHIAYIIFIAEHYSLPAPYFCAECYHPPLYYMVAAIFFKMGALLGLGNPLFMVTFLSLASYILYLYFSIRLLREFFTEKMTGSLAYIIALGLMVFWPLGFHMARIINNDVPVMTVQMAAFYYLLRWWRSLEQRPLIIALLLSALACNIKISGIVTGAVIAAVMFTAWRMKRITLAYVWSRPLRTALLVALLLTPVSFMRAYYDVGGNNAPPNFTLALAYRPHRTMPERPTALRREHVYYYTTFNLSSYLATPFYHVMDDNDGAGRAYFWNSLFKTAVLDEFNWKARSLARVLTLLELTMALYIAVTAYQARKFWPPPSQALWIPLGVFIGLQVAALMAFRVLLPFACSGEYRYIYVITAPMAIMYALTVQWQHRQQNTKTWKLGVSMAGVFVAASVVFILYEDLAR